MVADPEVTMLTKRAMHAIAPALQPLSEEYALNYGTLRTWRAGIRSPSRRNLARLAEVADSQADKLRGLAVELRRAADS